MERAYLVRVDGAEYKLKDGDLPVLNADGFYHVTVIRPSTGETVAYSRMRNGPYSFKR